MKHHIKSEKLAPQGKRRIQWAAIHMPVLKLIREKFRKDQTLKDVRLAACLHVTSETANLMIALKEGGATVSLCASNPLSTNDEVAASLVKDFGIPVFAINGEDNKTYYKHLNQVLDMQPNLTMDDGADLVGLLHGDRSYDASRVVGSSEETTTGVIRLRALQNQGLLKLPVVAVNDNLTKHFFDNRYGTGQSTIDGILRATNILIAGTNFVVCGYGWCGRGVASRARGMGARVTICEVDPVKALEAKMDGFTVKPLIDAIRSADVVLSVTGNKHVIDEKHMSVAKDGVILAQAGHFDVEINRDVLEKKSKGKEQLREFVEEFIFKGRRIYLLAQGRLVNLAAAEGHPASVMDMSFAGQAMAAKHLWEKRGQLEPKVYTLPRSLDEEIARLKLKAEGVSIDSLTSEQKKYLSSWEEGTA